MSTPGRVQVNGVTFVTSDVFDAGSAGRVLDRLTGGGDSLQRITIEPQEGKATTAVINTKLVWAAAAWVAPES